MGTNTTKGLHEEAVTIFCNRCRKHISKSFDTIAQPEHNNDIFCRWCGNWLCGFFDAFGYFPEEECGKKD